LKTRLLLCALIAAALPPAAAWAEPAFDVFETTCIDTSVDHAVALSTDAVRDWPAAPKAMVDRLSGKRPAGDVVSNAEVKMNVAAGGSTALVVAHSTHIADGVAVPADLCAVMVQGTFDVETLKAKAAEYAAVPVNQALVAAQFEPEARTSGVIYAWRDVGGRHVPLTMAEVAQAGAEDAVLVLTVIAEPGRAIIGLAVPRK
jgi:hypothetical protein